MFSRVSNEEINNDLTNDLKQTCMPVKDELNNNTTETHEIIHVQRMNVRTQYQVLIEKKKRIEC